MSNKIRLSQACDGMVFFKRATGRSIHTLSDYKNSFKKLLAYFNEDPVLNSITRKQPIKFFAWLQDEYIS